MSATLVHRGPDSRRRVRRRPGRARRAPALDHRPRHRRPADRERGRQRRRRAERRDLQLRGAHATSSSARGHRFRTHGDTEVIVHAYEQWGAVVRGAAARHVRGRDLGRPRAPARARARPLRDQAALLPRRGRRARVRVGAARAAARRGRPRRARGVPRVQLRAGAALDLPRTRASCRPATCSSWDGRRRADAASRARRRRPRRGTSDEAELVEELRARLRDSVRAHLVSDVPVGVLLSGGVDSCMLAALAARRDERAAADVLDRLRGALVRRARRRAARRRALRDRAPRARRCGRTRRCSSRRSPTRSTSRSPTRPRCRRTSSRSLRPRT